MERNINEGWLPADDPAATRNGTVGGAASRNAMLSRQSVACATTLYKPRSGPRA